MGTITSADAVITIVVPGVFPDPVQLQGFSADDIYDIDEIRSVETVMGIDGILSGGFVFQAIAQRITLQADSNSNAFFDAWWGAMKKNKATYPCNGQVRLPAVGTKFIQTQGFLTGYKASPPARRVLQPRQFTITWQSVDPAPI